MKSESYEFLKSGAQQHITIGFGSYGMVKLAKNAVTQQLVAIKMIYNKNAKEQIAMHKKLEHQNIVRLLNYYMEKERNITYMVLEYVDGGSLFEKVKSHQLTKPLIRKLFREICEAIDFLHRNGVMHRDIKPENILLTKKNEAKLCDFGFAALVGERKTLCGTYEYMAPEMVQNMTYDHKIDIWALGILLFEMIEGVAPFRGESPEEVLSQMKKSIYFSGKFETKEIQLIKSILRVNPNNRPEVGVILSHPYFEDEEVSSLANDFRSSTDASQESSPKATLLNSSPTTFEDKYRSFVETIKLHNSKFQPQPQPPLKKVPSEYRKLAPSLKPMTPTLQQLLTKHTSPTARDHGLGFKEPTTPGYHKPTQVNGSIRRL